jgi:hypothetical protein
MHKFGEELQSAATKICMHVLGSKFLLAMVGLSHQYWLSFLDALALVDYWFYSGIILYQG